MTADIVGEMGASGINLEKLIPIIKRELRSDEAINRQNAAFCVGMVAQASPAVIEKYKLTILQVPNGCGAENSSLECIKACTRVSLPNDVFVVGFASPAIQCRGPSSS